MSARLRFESPSRLEEAPGMSAACQCEIDQALLKARRADARKQQLRIKRSEYERSRSARSQPPPRARVADAGSRVNPHRLARAATRTCLAKGIVETVSDVPSIVSVGRSGPLRRRKPGVASVLSFLTSDAPDSELPRCTEEFLREFCCSTAGEGIGEDWQALLAEAETTASEDGDSDSVASCVRADSEDSLDTMRSCDIVAIQDEDSLDADGTSDAAEQRAATRPEPARADLAALAVAPAAPTRPEYAGWEVLPSFECLVVEGASWSLVA
uniref:Uncharacterized protein n=1 Tax=Alexandrium monilatum TaxID=311494 RepID=A0A7S4V0Z7_9DINO